MYLRAGVILTCNNIVAAAMIDAAAARILKSARSSLATQPSGCVTLHLNEILHGNTGERLKYKDVIPTGMNPVEFMHKHLTALNTSPVDAFLAADMPTSSGISEIMFLGDDCDSNSPSSIVTSMVMGRCYTMSSPSSLSPIRSVYIDSGDSTSVWIGSSANGYGPCGFNEFAMQHASGCHATDIFGTAAYLCQDGLANGWFCGRGQVS